MLISYEDVQQMMASIGFVPKGVLHVGAHDCEELSFYTDTLKIPAENCVWLEAMDKKVAGCRAKGVPNVYQAVVTDKDGDEITFHVSNNGQSSSILEFGTHAIHHNWVHYIEDIKLKTTTIDTFFKENKLDGSDYDFWNFDIQGAELMALRGASDALQWPKAIYLEVNTEEVYKGCGLLHEIDSLLSQRGFLRVLTKMTTANWGDALYLRMV